MNHTRSGMSYDTSYSFRVAARVSGSSTIS